MRTSTDMFLHYLVHCAADTWFADWVFVQMSRCTVGPIKVDGEYTPDGM